MPASRVGFSLLFVFVPLVLVALAGSPPPPVLGRVRAFVETCMRTTGTPSLTACLLHRIAEERRSAWVEAVGRLFAERDRLRWGCPDTTERVAAVWPGGDVVETADGHVLAVIDVRWDVQVHPAIERYHPGARTERRGVMRVSLDDRLHTIGLQCTYDAAGSLIVEDAAAGTLDRTSPRVSPVGHLVDDVRWYDAARAANCGCEADDRACVSSCDGHEGPWTDLYREVRPSPPALPDLPERIAGLQHRAP